jgi:hypothetical protein
MSRGMIRSRLRVSTFLATAALIMASAGTGHADGGVVRFNGPAGPFDVTVFTAPTPLRAGPVDFSVLIRDRMDRQPILNAQVSVRLMPGTAKGSTVTAGATRAQATNKLLYAALVDLPAAGMWNMEVTVRHGTEAATVSQRIEVAGALPPLLAFWPYLGLPPLAVALFIVHQRLSRQSALSGRRPAIRTGA